MKTHPAIAPAAGSGRSRPHPGRILLGLGSLLLGVVFVPLPVPLGWLFMLLGAALIANEVHWVSQLIRGCRARWRWGDQRLRQLEPISPPVVKSLLARTDPEPRAAGEEPA